MTAYHSRQLSIIDKNFQEQQLNSKEIYSISSNLANRQNPQTNRGKNNLLGRNSEGCYQLKMYFMKCP